MPNVELTEARKPLVLAGGPGRVRGDLHRGRGRQPVRQAADAAPHADRRDRAARGRADRPAARHGPAAGHQPAAHRWQKGTRLLVQVVTNDAAAGRRLRHPRADHHGRPRGHQDNQDALAKATVSPQVAPGAAEAANRDELDGGRHRRLLQDLHPRRAARPRCTSRRRTTSCARATSPRSTRRAARRSSSARRPGRCRSCRSPPTPRATWSPQSDFHEPVGPASGSGDEAMSIERRPRRHRQVLRRPAPRARRASARSCGRSSPTTGRSCSARSPSTRSSSCC